MCKKTFHTITKQEYQDFFHNNKRNSQNPIQEKQKSFALFASTTIENKNENNYEYTSKKESMVITTVL